MPSRLRRYDVPGHAHFWTISCYRRLTFFWHDSLKQVVIDGLANLRRKFEICLVAYVVMPEHVHIILYPHRRETQELVPISKLLEAFKSDTGAAAMKQLRELRVRHGRLWSPALETWVQSEGTNWTTRGYDFNIDRFDSLCEKVNYCHKNPVTRGLVKSPEDWRWSSHRYHELGDASVLNMDWDRAWPIRW